MTGGSRGVHRGRIVDRTGGAHWWRGQGPSGGGSHAVGGRRRRVGLVLVVLAVVGVIAALAVGVAVFLAGDGTGTPEAAAPSLPDAAVPSAGVPTDGRAGLQARLDATLTSTPVRFAPASTEPLLGFGLAPLADALRAAPGVPVTVEGHTAPVGADGPRAQELSRARANEVVRRLVALGVEPGRLTAVGRGDADPRPTLEESRRVELRVG